MKKLTIAIAALALPSIVLAQDEPEAAPSPNQIVEEASADEWVAIAAEDLLVMTLAPDAQGREREVILQLMPAPFSQGWVENIRTLARAEWYDGISVNRVQDNYVVQWGDPGHDNPESGEVETKPLPEGLNVMGEEDYVARPPSAFSGPEQFERAVLNGAIAGGFDINNPPEAPFDADEMFLRDRYSAAAIIGRGWALGGSREEGVWPVHCYGMVGVGRSYSPDTGSGAELYTVIGHAPRHLDRNIALVGRIISGMEHLSSLPRGSGALGFYTDEEAELRTPIQSIRVAADLPAAHQPRFEYLSTEGATFARYAEARTNRRDPFFIVPAGGADICNIPVPVRVVSDDKE
ncbi:peptidylprolyl isomerase [uncultured Erythrobacter sp.]|uniref:peptidylprolyl isomerase n=1 Tax=uncultured Erythrobacter sp. TaxID=263913 RepID=UPI00261AE796|nr:peptidylprolyl isomerase [uncultured Erythrobacter sp.]